MDINRKHFGNIVIGICMLYYDKITNTICGFTVLLHASLHIA
jgi:hypothetical protein